MLKGVNKISIIGGPGTGKTTLARNLGKELNLPVYHLDGIDHLENWKKRDREQRDKMILEKANKDKWIIDGTYTGTLETRIQKSDLVIFLNYSTIFRTKSVISRYLKKRGKEKPEIPGCKERMTWDFLKFTIEWKRKRENQIKEILERNKNKEILIYKKRKYLNAWYEKEFEKKIEK